MSQDLIKDILLQMQDQQQKDSQVLHELKGNLTVRVDKLESAQNRQWWMTYVVTPTLVLGHAMARKFGVNI